MAGLGRTRQGKARIVAGLGEAGRGQAGRGEVSIKQF